MKSAALQRKRVDNRVQEFVWAFGSNSEDEIEKQIARQIEQLKKSGDMEKLLHGSWSHMDAFDEDEWLEHLEEHLKEIVNIPEKMKEHLQRVWKSTDKKYMTVLHRNTQSLPNGLRNADIVWMNI
mgnify:CR=1 FL=1